MSPEGSPYNMYLLKNRSHTMTLQVDDNERAMLLELLEAPLGNLSYEISDTDRSNFKDQLRERRDVLQTIALRLKDLG